MTPCRTIRSLMSRISAGETISMEALRAAGLETAIEAICDDWAARGLVTRIARPGRPPGYAMTALGASTERWD